MSLRPENPAESVTERRSVFQIQQGGSQQLSAPAIRRCPGGGGPDTLSRRQAPDPTGSFVVTCWGTTLGGAAASPVLRSPVMTVFKLKMGFV